MDYSGLQDLIFRVIDEANAKGYLEYVEIYNGDTPMVKKYLVKFVLSEDIFGELMAKHILNNPSAYFKQSETYFETILGINYRVDKNLPRGTLQLENLENEILVDGKIFSN